MKRSARRFQPVLYALDKKTLLSAGQLAHLADMHRGTPEVVGDTYDYYAKLTNNTGEASLKVDWTYFKPNGKKLPSGSSGQETIKNGATKLIMAGPGTPTESQHGKFVITFTIKVDPKQGKKEKTVENNIVSTTFKQPNPDLQVQLSTLQAENLLPVKTTGRKR
jgi:hypothetical protein